MRVLRQSTALSIATIVLLIFILLIFWHDDHAPRFSVRIGPSAGTKGRQNAELDYFPWQTTSTFLPVRQDVTKKSIEDVCATFPRHLLNQVQPVLKIGHGVKDTSLRSHLNSVSACLSPSLLITSDVPELYQGHIIHDAIALLSPSYLSYPNDSRITDYHYQQNLLKSGNLPSGKIPEVKGWDLDALKFLTQISLAWRKAPEKRWYVFYEGDTYISWDNMFRFLEQYDPDRPWYFGSPSKGLNETYFGNGGPGFVLSREVVRRLVAEDWKDGHWHGWSKLSERWDELVKVDCCGDSVLGWAIHEDADTSLSGQWPMFNPHSVHGVPFGDMHWCQPVITLHRTSNEDMERLWRWEEMRRDLARPFVYADLVDFHNLTNISFRADWHNSDWDGYPAPTDGDAHSSYEDCGKACKNDDQCFQWTYHLRSCELVRSFRLGAARKPSTDGWILDEAEKDRETIQWTGEDQRFMSGWDIQHIKSWIANKDDRNCDTVLWMKPSIERIF